MDDRYVRCPDQDPQRQFVHRITEAECARRRAAGFHKCPGCVRATGVRAPIRFQGLLMRRPA
jgi:hypothetical protein